jgi:AcrR family transcriptional regulator
MTVLTVSEVDLGPVFAAGGTEQRIVDAALRCVARWGVAKTTLDDVAREAGCGRATLYRLFPGGRDALWDAVMAAEAQRFFAGLADRARAEHSLEDVLVGLVTEAARALTGHAALQFLLLHEPEAVLPHLAFYRGNGVLHRVSAVIAPLLAPWLVVSDAETAPRAAEWLARMVISYLTSPAVDVDLCEDQPVRRLVRLFVLPGLQPLIDPFYVQPTTTGEPHVHQRSPHR